MGADYFAGRLKELRVQAGYTQEALAERSGVSKGGIADLEQGRREPAWATVIALAGALGVGCQDFLVLPAASSGKAKRGRPATANTGPDTVSPPATGPDEARQATPKSTGRVRKPKNRRR